MQWHVQQHLYTYIHSYECTNTYLHGVKGICTVYGLDKINVGINPDSKAHGTNMRPIRGRQDLGGPHVGPMNFAIWETFYYH